MWVLWASAAHAAALPAIEVSWKGDAARITARAPAGEHVAAEAPVDLSVAWGGRELSYAAMGSDLIAGFALHAVRGQEIAGTIRLSVCDDGGTTCRPLELALRGAVPEARKGVVALDVAPAGAPAGAPSSPYRVDAAAVVREAMATATADGRHLLLDFTGVWCPPCNLMAAEVLDRPDPPEVLGRYVVARIDVDDPSAWELKDRYHVTGYPTVVVADATGREITRQVGYDDASAFVAWLERASAQEQTDAELVALGPEAVDPRRAGEVAWSLVRAGNEDVGAWLDRAAAAPDHLPYRLARVSVAPTLEDVRWLASNAPGEGLRWIPAAQALVGAEPAAAEALLDAVRADLARARGPEVADLLYLASELAPERAAVLNAAAAGALRTALSGDPDLDRGHYTWLASLMEKGGDPAGAVAFLDEAARGFPDELTFHHAAAGVLLRADRPAEALERADAALAAAWGDNRIRAATTRVKALRALGRAEEAEVFGRAFLAELPRPAEGLDVRTPRYVAELERAISGE